MRRRVGLQERCCWAGIAVRLLVDVLMADHQRRRLAYAFLYQCWHSEGVHQK